MPDITSDFIVRLRTNGAECQRVRTIMLAHVVSTIPDPTPGSTTGAAAASTIALHRWFYERVRSGGVWDFKANVYSAHQRTGVTVCGRHYRYDMPGNFHYGYTGKALGFPNTELYAAAGAAQVQARTSRPEYYCTFGDDPEDAEFIRLGILLYNRVQLGVSEAILRTVLGQFVVRTCPVPW